MSTDQPTCPADAAALDRPSLSDLFLGDGERRHTFWFGAHRQRSAQPGCKQRAGYTDSNDRRPDQSLAPNDLQFQQCQPLQDLRVALSLVGCAQDRFRDTLNMRGLDGLGKRSDRSIKRLFHHRDHLGREGCVGEILHGGGDKKTAANEPWGRDRIGSRLSLMCPSLGQLHNFPKGESFHGIDKFAYIAIDPGAVGCFAGNLNLSRIFRSRCGVRALDFDEDSGRRTAPIAQVSLRSAPSRAPG
jgi:hypothetical protein